jgi:hypothetical protein
MPRLLDLLSGQSSVVCGQEAAKMTRERLLRDRDDENVAWTTMSAVEQGLLPSAAVVLLETGAAQLDAMHGYPDRTTLMPFQHLVLVKATALQDFIACAAMILDPGADVAAEDFEECCGQVHAAAVACMEPADIAVYDVAEMRAVTAPPGAE